MVVLYISERDMVSEYHDGTHASTTESIVIRSKRCRQLAQMDKTVSPIHDYNRRRRKGGECTMFLVVDRCSRRGCRSIQYIYLHVVRKRQTYTFGEEI